MSSLLRSHPRGCPPQGPKQSALRCSQLGLELTFPGVSASLKSAVLSLHKLIFSSRLSDMLRALVGDFAVIVCMEIRRWAVNFRGKVLKVP